MDYVLGTMLFWFSAVVIWNMWEDFSGSEL